MISIDLTKEQIKLLKPYFDTIKVEHGNGVPCALLAQVFQDIDDDSKAWMEVLFVENEMVNKIQKVTGVWK